MEFRVTLTAPDAAVIDEAIRMVDPAALVDIDPVDQALRVTAWLDMGELVSLLAQAGYPVTPDQVHQIPSICCGGCSG
ncbi:hypothetical protein J2X04_001144 [Lysobacter niabensis]|uniref:HMA domain-containing protein n=1 Tax=Agrilutibacter niabensis TaxID=380628 RepID=A0ABU1VMT9_9GAMM|nr:hypothetical protein [Lysobacter niabensis]MDR7098797.1 hypothetical protein [Lysobacter niabensis]